MAKVHDGGKDRFLDILFDDQAVDATLYIGLYLNSAELEDDDVMTDIIEVSTGTGYARKALSRGSWTVSDGSALYDSIQTFLASGGDWGEVGGYFIATVQTGVSGVLMASEHLTTPRDIVDEKGIKVQPRFTIS